MSLTKVSYSMISGAAVNVLDYGADPTGAANSTDAFFAASAVIEANDGGKLVIPAGTYKVGKQTFAGAFGLGYSYLGATIISIQNCTKPVLIECQGARIVVDSSLKYGSFNPVTGAVYTAMPNYNTDYQASIGNIFNLGYNAQVKIYGALEIDGNAPNLILGGGWGDVGTQIAANGMFLRANEVCSVDGAYIHNHGADGIQVWFTGITEGATSRPTTLSNIKCQYNGRNGLSWVGGIGLTVIDSLFNYQGAGAVTSAPASGIDIEAESAVCRDGVFINCQMGGNIGPGMSAASGDSADMTFIGCSFYATEYFNALAQKPRYKFNSCRFIGVMGTLYNAPTYVDATHFTDCLFTADETFNGTPAQYSNILVQLDGVRAIFNSCAFESNVYAGQRIGSATASNCIFTTCVFNQTAAGTTPNSIQGFFYGGNVSVYTNGGANDYSGSTFFGRNTHSGTIFSASIDANGVIAQTVAPVQSLRVFGDDGGTGAFYNTFYLTAQPAAGTWRQGDIVINSIPAVGSPKGWTRVTTGSGNVLGVDWISQGNL
jgi:hypothetical protein